MPEPTVTCPTLEHILNSEQCFENLAGIGEVVYVGVKGDLSAPMTLTGCVYSTPTFKTGKGLFQIDCKEESNKIDGSSLGYRKGYKQTITFIIDAVNKIISKTGRALNNLDLFFIVPDGDGWQIMYDPYRKCKADADGIQTTTGAAAADERTTTCTFTLQPVNFPNFFVDITDIKTLLEGYTAES